eukprot:93476-Chlamydomonas_euryale.AAC.3
MVGVVRGGWCTRHSQHGRAGDGHRQLPESWREGAWAAGDCWLPVPCPTPHFKPFPPAPPPLASPSPPPSPFRTLISGLSSSSRPVPRLCRLASRWLLPRVAHLTRWCSLLAGQGDGSAQGLGAGWPCTPERPQGAAAGPPAERHARHGKGKGSAKCVGGGGGEERSAQGVLTHLLMRDMFTVWLWQRTVDGVVHGNRATMHGNHATMHGKRATIHGNHATMHGKRATMHGITASWQRGASMYAKATNFNLSPSSTVIN